jgi:hypothetical protein
LGRVVPQTPFGVLSELYIGGDDRQGFVHNVVGVAGETVGDDFREFTNKSRVTDPCEVGTLSQGSSNFGEQERVPN